jgi:hypothetical protein
MDIDYVVSCACGNFHSKLWKFVTCRKITNDVWVVRTTIHVILYFFVQDTYYNISGQNYLDAQDTT